MEQEPADVRELQKKISQLESRIHEYEGKYPMLYCDDMFEYLIIARSEAMMGKVKDAIECTADYFRRVQYTDETMQKVLALLPGRCVRDKKDALRDFLKENPHYRTKDPELLLQRLKLRRKYGEAFTQQDIPEHPIKDAIDAFNGPIPNLAAEEFE